MPSQVDLKDLTPDEPEPDAGTKTRERSRTSSRTRDRADKELRDRLENCFDRIAAALEAREDDDLAGIVREDAGIMAQGLVSLTRPFRALRTPLLAGVAIIEPALAFGRILRTLAGRFAYNRAMAREAAQAEQEAQPSGD